jgi:hypothetical protein
MSVFEISKVGMVLGACSRMKSLSVKKAGADVYFAVKV